MENRVKVRACFTGCNIKSGKTVMQFELPPAGFEYEEDEAA